MTTALETTGSIDRRGALPTKWLYAIPVVVLVIGVILFAFTLYRGTQKPAGEATRVVLPGSKEINLHRAGTYTIFYDYMTIPGDTSNTASADMPDLRLSVTSKASGQQLALTRTTSNMSYPLTSRHRLSVMKFEVARPGEFTLQAAYPDGRSDPPFVLTVATGVVGSTLGHVLVGFGLLVAGLAIAGGLTAIIFFMRYSARRRIQLGLTERA